MHMPVHVYKEREKKLGRREKVRIGKLVHAEKEKKRV
jgi:hypothetical protein